MRFDPTIAILGRRWLQLATVPGDSPTGSNHRPHGGLLCSPDKSVTVESDDVDQALLASLQDFERALAETGAGVARGLAPGVPPSEVRGLLGTIGMQPSVELTTWFAWHNGLRVSNPPSFGQGCLVRWCPLSVAEAIAERNRQDIGDQPWEWHPTWLPIGVTNNSSRLVIDCTPPQADVSEVRMVDPFEGLFGETERPRGWTLADAVRLWTESLVRGWWAFDDAADQWICRDPLAPVKLYGPTGLI